MSRVGICGSDVSFLTKGGIGKNRIEKPKSMGHEGSGTVVKCGPQVTHLKPGPCESTNEKISLCARITSFLFWGFGGVRGGSVLAQCAAKLTITLIVHHIHVAHNVTWLRAHPMRCVNNAWIHWINCAKLARLQIWRNNKLISNQVYLMTLVLQMWLDTRSLIF